MASPTVITNSAARSRGFRKSIRDAFQALLAVVAAGGATVGFETFVGTLAPAYSGLLAIGFKILIAYAQNYLETAGKIPVMLPTPGLVTSSVAPIAQATVKASASATGAVSGDVTDTTGEKIGEVSGQANEAKVPEMKVAKATRATKATKKKTT